MSENNKLSKLTLYSLNINTYEKLLKYVNNGKIIITTLLTGNAINGNVEISYIKNDYVLKNNINLNNHKKPLYKESKKINSLDFVGYEKVNINKGTIITVEYSLINYIIKYKLSYDENTYTEYTEKLIEDFDSKNNRIILRSYKDSDDYYNNNKFIINKNSCIITVKDGFAIK